MLSLFLFYMFETLDAFFFMLKDRRYLMDDSSPLAASSLAGVFRSVCSSSSTWGGVCADGTVMKVSLLKQRPRPLSVCHPVDAQPSLPRPLT